MTEETPDDDDDKNMEDVKNIEPKIEIVENRDWINPPRVIHCKMCSETVSEASFAGHLRVAHDSDQGGYSVLS